MPHNFDFSNCNDEIKTVVVNPVGWRNPITIEYSTAHAHKYDTMLSVVWRVKGTSHTFTIYERRLNVISNANYKKHFEEALEAFREDYLSWFSDTKYAAADWKYEYEQQYKGLILPDDNKSK